jgi:glutathione S-transferase
LRHLGIAVDPVRWPKLAAFAERMLARPSFKSYVDREAAFLERSA